MNSETWGINEMDKNKKKKSGRRKAKRPIFRKHSVNGGVMGGASRWRPPPLMPRRDYSKRTEQRHFPREEKSHWNGRVQMWTEPQKPRREKIVKYEVDTDKLLRELARGNKEALNEIAEKLKEEKAETNTEEKDAENLQKKDSPEKIEADSSDAEPDKSDESLERLPEETETNKDTNRDEVTEEKTETSDEAKGDQTETVEKAEVTQENQEMPQDIESETETNPKEEPLDSPELVYMSPSFWEQLESEMSDELEQMEPEENLEISQEESEPLSEGY